MRPQPLAALKARATRQAQLRLSKPARGDYNSQGASEATAQGLGNFPPDLTFLALQAVPNQIAWLAQHPGYRFGEVHEADSWSGPRPCLSGRSEALVQSDCRDRAGSEPAPSPRRTRFFLARLPGELDRAWLMFLD